MQRIIKSKMIQRMVSLFLVMLLVSGGFDRSAFAAGASTGGDELNKYPDWSRAEMRFTHNAIYLSANLRGGLKPTGFEIYRATVDKDNKIGIFRKIKTVKDIEKKYDYAGNGTFNLYWEMHYRDTDVKIGQMYAYKVRAYKKSGNKITYTYFALPKRLAACGNEIGKFKCKVVTSTKKKLVLKLTSDKNNGPWVMKKGDDYRVRLVAKESENSEIVEKSLTKNKISRDGKTWYDVSKIGMTIRKGESVYLSFVCGKYEKSLLEVGDYEYVQMLLYCMRYNGLGMIYSERDILEMRINIPAKKAEIGNYDHWDREGSGGYIVEWDNGEFVTNEEERD